MMYIKDLTDGTVRKYGTNHHDSLRISSDGRLLSYENLQNGDGSRYGDYRFCDKNGLIPEEDKDLIAYGADAYFNIGGFDKVPDMSLEEAKNILDNLDPDTIRALLKVLSNALYCCEEVKTSVGPMLLPKGSQERMRQKNSRNDERGSEDE